jgi:hypothetical protein
MGRAVGRYHEGALAIGGIGDLDFFLLVVLRDKNC